MRSRPKVEKEYPHGAEGSLLDLRVRLTRSAIWVGPAWAVICGAAASGDLALDWRVLVSLLVAVALADPVLSSAWNLANASESRGSSAIKENPGPANVVPALPYTAPGSLADRLREALSRRVAGWSASMSEQAGELPLGLGFASLVTLLLAALLGVGPLLLAVVALAVVLLRLVVGDMLGRLKGILGTAVLSGIPWLLGYAVFAKPLLGFDALGSVGAALLWAATYATVFHACKSIASQELSRGGRLLVWAQIAAIVVLIVAKQPILGAAVALLLVPQAMLQPPMLRLDDGAWYLRRAQPFTLLATLATALALAA
jgi:hypothetical protein